MQKKTILRNATMTFVQVLISGAILFLLYRYLLKNIGVELLGVWSIVLATTMAAKIGEMGFSGSVVKFVAKHMAHNDSKKVSEIIETAVISVAIIIGSIAVLAYIPLRILIEYIVPSKGMKAAMTVFPYALISLWMNSVAGVFQSGLDGCQRMDLRSILLVGGGTFYFFAVILLVPVYGFIGLAYAQVIQAGVLTFVGWFLLKHELSFLPAIPVRWFRTAFTEMWSYSVNFQVNSVMTMLYDPITKALLSNFGGLAMVGYYEMANRMVLQLRAGIISANQVLVPAIAGLAENSPERLRYIYYENYRLLLYLSLPFFAAIIMSIPLISDLWIGHYESIFVMFSIFLTIGWFSNLMVAPGYFANLGTGRLRWNTTSHISIAMLNIILGIALGSVFGGIGVVIAWTISLVLGSAVVVVSYHIENHITFRVLFPGENRWLAFASACGMLFGLLIFNKFNTIVSMTWLAPSCLMVFLAIVVPVFYVHPMTKRMKGWITSGFKRHN
jgi:O-antigen/teichoic acid export membrane protein